MRNKICLGARNPVVIDRKPQAAILEVILCQSSMLVTTSRSPPQVACVSFLDHGSRVAALQLYEHEVRS